MTTSDANIANDAARVGIQAQVVHGDIYLYQVPDGASAEEKFNVGVNYLQGGMPTEARKLIGEAIAGSYQTSRVWFYWLLALVSRRTLRQLSEDEQLSLRAAREQISPSSGDEWTEGLRVIDSLLTYLEMPDTELRLDQFDQLGPEQRSEIFRHLDMLLKGPIEDQIWNDAIKQVEADQKDEDREGRVWMFFQPAPREPRLRDPEPIEHTRTTQARAVSTPLFAAALAWTGWLLLAHGKVPALCAFVVSIGGGYACYGLSLDWCHRVKRLHAKEAVYRPPESRAPAPRGGFADHVDKRFDRYLGRYVPAGTDRETWLAATAGIRRHLRDEIVYVYRESTVTDDEIAWLIRHQVWDLEERWRHGTLHHYRQELRMPTAKKWRLALSLVVFVLSVFAVVDGVMRADPWGAALAATLLLTGVISAVGWLQAGIERRRYEAEKTESDARLAASQEALRRWQKKLERKPSDSQMAKWLDCDRKMLLHETMRHYRMRPSQVITHAFIEAPAPSSRRARVRNGPWRYWKYELIAFLLTTDGVRQLTACLDFETGTFHDRKRTNYRFDAVAAVQVTEKDDHQRTFELTLVNGPPIKVAVTESSTERPEELQQGEDSGTLSNLTFDATGFTNTLHVLEGVAAEGKQWIRHEKQRWG